MRYNKRCCVIVSLTAVKVLNKKMSVDAVYTIQYCILLGTLHVVLFHYIFF